MKATILPTGVELVPETQQEEEELRTLGMSGAYLHAALFIERAPSGRLTRLRLHRSRSTWTALNDAPLKRGAQPLQVDEISDTPSRKDWPKLAVRDDRPRTPCRRKRNG